MQNLWSWVICYIRKKIQTENIIVFFTYHMLFYYILLFSSVINLHYFPSSFPSLSLSHLPKCKHHFCTHPLNIRSLYLNYYWYTHTHIHIYVHTTWGVLFSSLCIYVFRTYDFALNNQSQCYFSLGESTFPYSHIC